MIPLDPGGKARVSQLKVRLSSAVGGASDHLSLARLFNDWAALSSGEQYRFAAANSLSNSTLLMIHGMRQQLQRELAQRGLLPPGGSGVAASDSNVVRQVLVRLVLLLLLRNAKARYTRWPTHAAEQKPQRRLLSRGRTQSSQLISSDRNCASMIISNVAGMWPVPDGGPRGLQGARRGAPCGVHPHTAQRKGGRVPQQRELLRRGVHAKRAQRW